VTSLIFRVEAVQEEDRMGLEQSKTMHGEFDIFSSGEGPSQAPERPQQVAAARPQAQTGARPMPVRVEKQTGRNDPCWCGSGKKFKKCHGSV